MNKIYLIASVIFGLCVSISKPLCASDYEDSTKHVVIANDTCRNIDKYLTQLAMDKNFSGGLLIIK
ncbi:MAG: hypothetical protein RL596_2468, partial [Bacteroidota bacterium]